MYEFIAIGDNILIDEGNFDDFPLVDDNQTIAENLSIYDEIIPLPPSSHKKNGRLLPEPDHSRILMKDGQLITSIPVCLIFNFGNNICKD